MSAASRRSVRRVAVALAACLTLPLAQAHAITPRADPGDQCRVQTKVKGTVGADAPGDAPVKVIVSDRRGSAARRLRRFDSSAARRLRARGISFRRPVFAESRRRPRVPASQLKLRLALKRVTGPPIARVSDRQLKLPLRR